MFCTHCGNEIPDGAQFCPICGTPVKGNNSNSQRQQEYVGKIYKCPNCGQIINSFMRNCPACGYELRNVQDTSAVKEFERKLENIQAKRVLENRPKLKRFELQKYKSDIDQEIISLIQNFVVPNTKEDMLEFMILATSNIDYKKLHSFNTVSEGEVELNQAWFSKIKQTYQKAKLSYGNEKDFYEIEDLYNEAIKSEQKQKKKVILIWVALLFPIWIWIPILAIGIPYKTYIVNPREETRLSAEVDNIEEKLDDGKYRDALSEADAIDYNGNDNSRSKYWKSQKKYLIQEILEDAEENGVHLEYKSDDENEDEDDSSTSAKNKSSDSVASFGGGFVKGFTEAISDSMNEIDNKNK